MVTNYGNQQRVDIATMMQAQLAAIGVKVNIRVLEWNTFVERLVTTEYESCVMGWKVGTRADLTEFWHSASTGRAGMNISGYRNAEVDRLITAAKNTLDVGEAKRLWSECQRIIYSDQPFMFLAIPFEVVGLSGKFSGVEPNAISFFANLREWDIAEPSQ